jgi:hypothetical protein
MQLLGLTLQAPNLPSTAKNAIKYLLSRRILRSNGLRAFLTVMLAGEHDGTSLAKYEHIGTLLSTPPRSISIQVRFINHISVYFKISTRNTSELLYRKFLIFYYKNKPPLACHKLHPTFSLS